MMDCAPQKPSAVRILLPEAVSLSSEAVTLQVSPPNLLQGSPTSCEVGAAETVTAAPATGSDPLQFLHLLWPSDLLALPLTTAQEIKITA